MELYKQIKRYRTDMNLSQEELAEKIYVTRQTISNWENDKSYPDIHSLLLLSSTFHISLDQLIKGDITTMKEEISKEAIQKFYSTFNINCHCSCAIGSIFRILWIYRLGNSFLNYDILRFKSRKVQKRK